MTTAPSAVDAPPGMAVSGPRSCIKCGYNLQGLPVSGVCPECGTPTADSLRGILLQFASPEYIATVRQGHSWVLNGILAQIAAVACMLVLGFASGFDQTVVALGYIVFLAVTIVIFLGYLKLTAPDPQFQGEEKPDSARTFVRYAVIGQVGILILQVVVEVLPAAPATRALPTALGYANLATTAAQLLAMMLYTRWLAQRVPDAYITRRTKVYVWLLPLLQLITIIEVPFVALGSLVALVLYWNLLHRMRKHLRNIEQIGAPATLPNMTG